MIKLTDHFGHEHWVNPNSIDLIQGSGAGGTSYVFICGDKILVGGDVDQVMDGINRARAVTPEDET